VILAETYADLFDKDKELVLPGIGKFALGEICLLDMRGKSDLSSNDRHMLKVFVFGGILGDHPPRDRTKALR
jgi:ribosome biogenesis SPOUT family RNA methylase Rps3